MSALADFIFGLAAGPVAPIVEDLEGNKNDIGESAVGAGTGALIAGGIGLTALTGGAAAPAAVAATDATADASVAAPVAAAVPATADAATVPATVADTAPAVTWGGGAATPEATDATAAAAPNVFNANLTPTASASVSPIDTAPANTLSNIAPTNFSQTSPVTWGNGAAVSPPTAPTTSLPAANTTADMDGPAELESESKPINWGQVAKTGFTTAGATESVVKGLTDANAKDEASNSSSSASQSQSLQPLEPANISHPQAPPTSSTYNTIFGSPTTFSPINTMNNIPAPIQPPPLVTSDRHNKTNIRSAKRDIQNFLNQVRIING